MKRLTPRQRQLIFRRLMRKAFYMLIAGLVLLFYGWCFFTSKDRFITASVTIIIFVWVTGTIILTACRRHAEKKRRKLNYYYKLKREGRI